MFMLTYHSNSTKQMVWAAFEQWPMPMQDVGCQLPTSCSLHCHALFMQCTMEMRLWVMDQWWRTCIICNLSITLSELGQKNKQSNNKKCGGGGGGSTIQEMSPINQKKKKERERERNQKVDCVQSIVLIYETKDIAYQLRSQLTNNAYNIYNTWFPVDCQMAWCCGKSLSVPIATHHMHLALQVKTH